MGKISHEKRSHEDHSGTQYRCSRDIGDQIQADHQQQRVYSQSSCKNSRDNRIEDNIVLVSSQKVSNATLNASKI
jgi:hypothetical protein